MKLLGGRSKKAEEPARRRAANTRLEQESYKFRRSATLTGSLSDDIKTPAEERGQLQSDRVEAQSKRKKQQKRRRRFGYACLVIVILAIAYCNHISNFSVGFTGDPSRLPMVTPYELSAKEFASSSFGSQFMPSMKAAKLAEYVMGRHKEIASIHVERRLFSKQPRLVITLRKPVLMWQTRADATPFYVDAGGAAFTFNGYANDADMVRVNDESGVPAELGVPIASSRQISFLGQLVGQVTQTSKGSVVISKIVFPSSSTKQINVHFKDRKFYAKVYLERSAKAQGDEVVRGLQYLDGKQIVPAEYIDVRIAERIFYK